MRWPAYSAVLWAAESDLSEAYSALAETFNFFL